MRRCAKFSFPVFAAAGSFKKFVIEFEAFVFAVDNASVAGERELVVVVVDETVKFCICSVICFCIGAKVLCTYSD